MKVPMSIQNGINHHTFNTGVKVRHITPVHKDKWGDILVADTFATDVPWTWTPPPTGLFEVFTTGSVFFNNRDYTDYFVVVWHCGNTPRMCLCHYNYDLAVSKVICIVDAL